MKKRKKEDKKVKKKMSEINNDTAKMKDCGNDIIRLANELSEVVEALFNRIEQIPTVTQEWVGAGAQEFARRASIEKRDYLKLRAVLISYGRIMVNVAENYENVVARCTLR